MKRNFVKLWLRDACVSASASFVSISVLSAFFMRGGMTAVQVSFYISFTQVVNLVFSLLFSGITSKYRDTRRSLSVLYIVSAIATLIFIILCLIKFESDVFFILVLIIGTIISAVSAIRFVFDYKLPCEVIDISDYSTYVSFSGIFCGIAGILPGIALTFLYRRFDFNLITGTAFILSSIFLLASAAFNSKLTIINESAKADANAVKFAPIRDFKLLFSNNDFRALMFPNFIRGAGAGVVSMITVIALKNVNMSDGDVSMITSATYAATLVSCLIYSYIAKKFGSPVSCLVGSIIFGALTFSLCGEAKLFLGLYFAAYIGYNIVCCAIPDMVYQSVDSEIIGAFHTWRMVFTTLGTSISAAAIGALTDIVPAWLILIVGTLSIFICSVSYFLHYNKTLISTERNVKS